MEQSSHQREVRLVDPAWSLSELMARLAKALLADGPALALSPVSQESVNSQIALIVNTTGSAGVVKEVGLTAGALLASAKASHSFIGARSGERWSLFLPLNHIAGINVLVRSLELGTIPLDYRGRVGENQVRYNSAEFSSLVPTQLFRALNGDSQLLDHLRGCRTVLVGGAPLTAQLREEAQSQGVNIVETYGSTETAGGCIYDGEPLRGVHTRINEGGHLQISGSVLAHSYLNLKQALVDEEGWYTSSDLARYEDEKVFIEGRSDDVFISGGENISLASIEAIIARKFPSLQSAFFTVDNPEWGQSLCCALISAESSIETEVQEALSAEIGNIVSVKSFLHLDSMPLIGIGKVNRSELQRLMGL